MEENQQDEIIPSAQDMVCPLLVFIKDGKQYHLKDIEEPLGQKLDLTAEQMEEKLPSGSTRRFFYRLGWTKHFLKKAGLIEALEKAEFKISQEGIDFLEKHPNFTHSQLPKPKPKPPVDDTISEPPRNKEMIKRELADHLKKSTPEFFEKIMTRLLENMEYGKGETTGRSGDGGIDGIVTADKLGLTQIYMQAKRYSGMVPIAHIKQFIGTIQTTQTKTGVFVTSGNLPNGAYDVVRHAGLNIRLIDGEKLCELMYDSNVGVKEVKVEPIKEIDEAFFAEEDV